MARVRRLAKPPISEAVIDLIFKGSQADRSQLEELASALLPNGWKKNQLASVQATFNRVEIDGQKSWDLSKSAAEFEGFALGDPAQTKIIQLRPNRLTVSHLKAYTCWEDLEADAQWVCAQFIEKLAPTQIIRVASRFINRLPLPSDDFTAFEDLLERPPARPHKLSTGAVTDFAHQDVIRGIEDGFTAKLMIGTVAPLAGELSNSIVIDTDVFKEQEITATFESALPALGVIHRIKNQLFFESVTERALEPYQ